MDEICEINGEKFKCETIFKHLYGFSGREDKDIETRMIPPKEFLLTTYKEVIDRRTKASDVKRFEGFHSYLKGVIIPKNVEGIKFKMKQRECSPDVRLSCLPIPFLTFDDEGNPIGHEGRHTAKASEELGLKAIPVTIEKPKSVKTPLDNFLLYKKQYG